MSNRTSLIVAILIVVAVALDLMLNGGRVSFFLAKKTTELIEYMAFWR